MLEIQDKNILYEDKTEQVFKSIFFSVKNYAEEYETLFVAFVTIGASIIATFFNFGFYFYKIGYYSHFGIDESIILSSIKENSLLLIGYYLSGYLLIILFNILAYVSYINRKFLWFCLPWILVVSIWSGIHIIKSVGFGYFKENGNSYIIVGAAFFIAIAVNTVVVIGILFSPVFIHMWIFPSKKVKLNRYELKLEQIAKRGSREDVLKYKIKHRKILKYKKKNLNKESEKIVFVVKICITIFVVFFCFFYLQFIGHLNANANNSINIINKNNITMVALGLAKIDSYAVVYEDTDFLIISPSNEENGELHIFKNYQIKIERNNQLLMKQTYKKIVMENTVSLTSESA